MNYICQVSLSRLQQTHETQYYQQNTKLFEIRHSHKIDQFHLMSCVFSQINLRFQLKNTQLCDCVILYMQNQQDPTTKSINSSTKWIDYSQDESGPQFSDSDEQQNNSKQGSTNNNNTNTNNEQYSLSDIHRDMVWLLVEITSGNTKQASSRLYDLKHEDQRTQVYATVKGQYNKYDLKISKDTAEKLMLKGIQGMRNLTFKIHIRNFQRRDDGNKGEGRGQRRPRGQGRGGRGRGDRGDRPDRGDRGQRGQRRQRRDRGERGERGDGEGRRGDGQKKKYVDKQTGKQSQTKKLFEQRIAQQKNRQYTKKQSKEIGQSLGSFRNRPLEQRREQKQQLKEQQQQKDKEKQKENKDKQVPEKKPEPKPKTTWNRKPTQEEVIPEAAEQSSNTDGDKKSATTQEKRKQSQEIQKSQPKKDEEGKSQADAKDKKGYTKKEPKVYKPAPVRIDVNEETTRLFKKASDIRDDKEYRSATFNQDNFEPAQSGNFKKNEKSKERKNYQQKKQSTNGDVQPKNKQDQASRQQQQLQKQYNNNIDRNYKKKYSQQREPTNHNNYRNDKPRKYQEKKQKNEDKDKKQPEQSKKDDKKEDKKSANHFHGMMSDDSDN